jgi:hypothetical protein
MLHKKNRIAYQTINGKMNYKQSEREYESREMIKRNKIAKKFQGTGTKPGRKTSTIQKKIINER